MQPVQKASNIGSATLKHLKRASEKDNFLACLRPNSSNGGKRMDIHVIINDLVVCWGSRQRKIVISPHFHCREIACGNTFILLTALLSCAAEVAECSYFPIFSTAFFQTYIHTCFLFPSGYSYGTLTGNCICYSYGILTKLIRVKH